MMNTKQTSRELLGVTTACATAAGIALAPTADADGSDGNFLAMLSAAGIPAHDGIPGVISYGHKVCDALNGGESPSSIANTRWPNTATQRTRRTRWISTSAQWWRSSGCRRRHTAPARLAVLLTAVATGWCSP